MKNHPNRGNTDRKISLRTIVVVTRIVKFSNQEPNVWGPMPLALALKNGHIETSGGTVSISVTIADTAPKYYAGANCYRDQSGQWRCGKSTAQRVAETEQLLSDMEETHPQLEPSTEGSQERVK